MKKKILFVLTMIIAGTLMLSAQQTPNMPTSNKYYKATWKKIDSLQQKGKVRDALGLVKELMVVAKKEANYLQRIKGLGTQIELIQPIEEKSDSLSLALIKGELAQSQGIARSLLQTMLGDYYYQYYQQHRWRINERSALEVSDEDFTTWDVQTLMEAAAQAYLASLRNDSLLKEVPIRTLREVLNEGKDSYKYRPTLYDVLAHRAIDFFQNPETRLARSANEFELPAEKAFTSAAEFAEASFESEYAYDRNLQAVQLLQDLIRFHLNTEEPEPLVEVDLKRLAFAREIAVGEQKDTLYLQALEQLKAKHEGDAISTSITYPIAELYQERARKYNPFDPDSPYKWDLKRAWTLAEEAAKAFPESEGAALCRNLQLEIEQRSLELQTAEAVVPDQEFLTFCRYRNLEKLFVRVAALSEATEKELEDFGYNERREKVQFMQQLFAFASKSIDLPEDPDYQTHSVELPMPELPVGRYLLMVSDDSDFSTDEHVLAYGMVSVTELSCLTESRPDGMQVFVQDRESGKPEKRVSVQLMRYEYESRSYKPVGKAQETPKDGRVVLPYDGDNYGNYAISLSKKDDHFQTDGFGGRYRDYEPYKQPVLTYFFLDRKLYRPGQAIYFKGLVMGNEGESYEILPNHPARITFTDANNQEVKTLDVKTNEYGTFSGSFTAPRSGLMGRMQISGQGGNTNFHVEEYKRPTFEVTFDTLEGSYRLGDEVVASGQAKAYAGSALSFAEVRYRVRREARFPYWGWRWWLPQPSSPAREIASGTVRADANGKFEIPFTLIPDGTIDKDDKPIFNYTVEADVVDLTGETRSGNTLVRAGYVALDVALNVPSTLQQDDLGKARIQSNNLAGKEEMAKGTMEVFRLQEPDRLLRQRQWSQPDKYLMSQEEFAERFPHDAYGNQLEPKRWEKGEKVLSLSFNTSENKELDLQGLAKAEPGMYRFELKTEDRYGTEIKVTAFSTLEESDAKSPALPEVLNYTLDQDNATYEPGETARLKVRTSARKAYVLYKIVRDEEVLREGLEKIKRRRPLELEIPIREGDRGGLAVQLSLVYANRPLTYQLPISVPWSNKQLSLEWGTFRSELRPGQEEEWTIKLKGPKGEQVAAEMVAALYDASLDAIGHPNHYSPISLFPSHRPRSSMSGQGSFGSLSFQRIANNFNRRPEGVELHGYDELDLLGDSRYFGGGRVAYQRMQVRESMNMPLMAADAPKARGLKSAPPEAGNGEEMAGEPMAEMDGDGVPDLIDQEPAGDAALDDVPVRKNLSETAFFFPHLQSDEAGNFVLKFTMPEALTRWKFLSFAHSKSLQSGVLNGETVTQKELMVTPNVPRFLRKGDVLTLPAKVANLTEEVLSGTAQLYLFDAFTMEDVSSKFGKLEAVQRFQAEGGQTAALAWDLTVPNDVPALVVQVVARAGDFSDGEEHIVPILSNRMLVTESIPLTVRGGETKEFSLRKLVINPSTTIEHQRLTLEFTSNPAWYAVQALPYLMEYPHECSEQVFSRFYANALASHIATSQPRIKQIFDQWRQQSENDAEARGALLSSLETNQELKSVLLEETPWLLNARDESERKQRVALLFDLNRMADELGRAKRKLSELQNGDGGFSWFPGMRSSPYITNLIVTGMGHLQKLGVGMATGDPEVSNMVSQAIPYLDGELKKSYEYLQRYVKKEDMDKNHLSNWAVQYLYMRSFYPEVPQAEGTEEAFAYYAGQAESYWNEKNHYTQGMLSLVFHRKGDNKLGREVLSALKQQSVWNPELGMYWKSEPGYFWYEAPIERQAMLIEAFHEVSKDLKTVEELKLWLLRNKQTNDWETTRATVAACNALLMVGKDLLADTQPVEVTVGGIKVDPAERPDAKVEAGTGYFKTAWQRGEIRREMGNVTVSKKGDGIGWGALYWQYFEDMDKITYAETPLKVKKTLFVEKNTPEGPQLTALGEQNLQAGDKVIVRIELRVDRDMEYVHMKDQRAAGFEPINVLSQYKYQDGLAYYESTRDAATHFFFSRLRGNETYVFEYPLRVNQAGDFSNGITTVQCMYAPEFTSHSEGMRVKVEKR